MGRCSMIGAIVTTTIAFVLLVVGFLGQNPHANSLHSVYFLKVETDFLADIKNDVMSALNSGNWDQLGSDLESTYNELTGKSKRQDIGDLANTASDVAGSALNGGNTTIEFTIGASGYCIQKEKCVGKPTPFYFDFETTYKSITGQDLPDDIKQYQTYIKNAGKAIWVMSVIGIAAAAISVCTGFFAIITSFCSKVSTIARFPAVVTSLVSTVGVLSILGSAIASTGLYAVIKSKLNDYNDETNNTLKLKCSMGAAGLALYWVSFLFAMFAAISWGHAARASRRQIAYMAPAPQAYGGAGSYYH